MTKTIRLIFIFLVCLQITAFAQDEIKGFTKKEISRKLTRKTLKSIENDSISDFLKGFAKAIKKGDFTDLKSAVSQEFYKDYLIEHEETTEDYDTDIEKQSLFLIRCMYVYVGENRFYGDYMKEYHIVKDWTTIKKVHFTKFTYKPTVDYGHYSVVDYWVTKAVFITEDDEYYLATVICRIDEKTKKVTIFRAH